MSLIPTTRAWLLRLAGLFGKRRRDRELGAEIDSNLQLHIDDNLRAGMTPQEARRQALLKFGGIESAKENYRDRRGIPLLETTWQDIRFALRMLRKTPLITGVALLSLAFGIGANTVIFSLIDAVMLRMLPVQNPEQLVQIAVGNISYGDFQPAVTNPIWEQIRDHQDAFSGVVAWSPKTFDLADGGEVNDIHGIYASGGYFNVLGVRPAAGRLFSSSDDVRGCSGVAVLGYGFWQSRYAGAEKAIGSLIRLNGHSFPIIGVAQRGFFGTDVGDKLDVAIPICAEAILDGKNSMLDDRTAWFFSMMGRLKPGTTIGQAYARMKALSPLLFSAVVPQNAPAKYQDIFRKYTFYIFPGATGAVGFYGVRQQYIQPLRILMFVVGLVLLIACANIASLVLARSAARQKEVAVRLALGASRTRLIRQVLTESIVLSGLGAILGVLFARWGSALLVRFVSRQQNPVFLDLKMDGRVLAFTISIAVLCGLLFGILPAFRATRVSAISAMKEGQLQSGGRSRSAAARWIIAAQVALSLILLVGAGLFIHTFTNLMTIDTGFDRNNVLMVKTNVHSAGIPEPSRAPLYSQMLAKLRALPDVVSASQCWIEPLAGKHWADDVTVPGHPGVELNASLNWVTPGYFGTMRTRLLEGRAFDARDSATSTPVVVVNQLLARRYFDSQSPIGQHLMVGAEGFKEEMLKQPLEIIGVVQDAKYGSLKEDPRPEAYFPLSQIQKNVSEDTAFEIRTAMPPSALIPAIRDAMGSVNKLASLQFTTLKQQADDSVLQQHLMAVLSGFFGGLALLLTAIGLYGVMAYMVTLRTHEIGIRMALGAQQRSILKPNDPSTLALAIVVLVAVALLAAYIPARRAMRVDPMVALRHE